LDAWGWNSTTSGAFNKSYPQTSSDFSFTPGSLHWEGITGQNTQVCSLSDTGIITSRVDTGHYENWEAACEFSIIVNAPGNYDFNLSHDDGAMMGFKATGESGGTCVKVSGSVINDAWGTKTALAGYDYMAGNNNSGTHPTDPLKVTFAGGTYPQEFKGEINWTNWEHSSRMILTFGAGIELVDISGAGGNVDTTSLEYIVKDICTRSNVDPTQVDATDLA